MGDTEANIYWIESAFQQIADRFARYEIPRPWVVLHVGDVGIGYSDRAPSIFTRRLDSAARAQGLEFRMIDGNHDDHQMLNSWPDGYPPGCRHVRFIPRNTRWEWHGRVWHALGGAVSPNRSSTVWDQDEMPSDLELAQAKTAGHADVMITHEAPAGVPIIYGEPLASWNKMGEFELSAWYRAALADVVAELQPGYVIHGHNHQGDALWREVPFTKGATSQYQVCSLDVYGRDGNWRLLDLRDMKLY